MEDIFRDRRGYGAIADIESSTLDADGRGSTGRIRRVLKVVSFALVLACIALASGQWSTSTQPSNLEERAQLVPMIMSLLMMFHSCVQSEQ